MVDKLQKPKTTKLPPQGEANCIQEIIELLRSVDIDAPEAELNAISISDNNGGRILL